MRSRHPVAFAASAVLLVLAWFLLAGIPGASARGEPPPAHARAHWLTPDLLVWPHQEPGANFTLHAASEGGLSLDGGEVTGGEARELTVVDGGLPHELRRRYPHLRDALTLRLPPADDRRLDTLLRGQLLISARPQGGGPASVTGLQLPGVLDHRFPYDGPLGVVMASTGPVFRLWAPTAKAVRLLHYADADPNAAATAHAMTRDPASGTWTFRGPPSWEGSYYRYEVSVFTRETGRVETNRVTDPYAHGLSADSARSWIVDLEDPALFPAGWARRERPAFSSPVDAVLYELHVRDFSIRDDTVPLAHRGTFRAFRHRDSLGMQHLARLQAAGLSHVHLLPVFDIATVPERREEQAIPDPARLAAAQPESDEQQALISEIRDRDGFNWGYDPWHYTVPEGSYATDPDGPARILEFREMVQALNDTGLRVVMDVVYNHTHAAGRSRGSVLDQIVPGYYHRLDADGRVETSTCCANTASEHAMMEKLLIDSVLTWARAYGIEGFRFDLMGHHGRDTMLKLRQALDGLTPEADGVRGNDIILYGEGWNFGEVANDARFVQARQGRLAGSGIGTFSDRLRDGARGGLYNAHPSTQGFINGLADDPSEFTRATGRDPATLALWTDWIRVGLAGDLADYRFTASDGSLRSGAEIDYNGSPAGYTAAPAENISYVAAHDNETLFDANQLKLPVATTMADRVRVQTLANALAVLGQGVPFVHAGQEFLRSKSMDRDSFNSGDWFNAIDWRFEDGNWGRGLPVEDKNGEHWPAMRPLLADPALAPDVEHRRQALADFEALLNIRRSTPLFRLRDLDSVQRHLAFHNTGPDAVPGLIVMSLHDPENRLGGPFGTVVVLFNARVSGVRFTLEESLAPSLRPHPAQPDRMAGTVAGNVLTAPPRSVAVFVAER
ncbi:MAG: pullulanase-type alpha-1,6-glucosidase [Xanthomonadales bacterium]|jgi:pullulanase-type alpha-1,6-glucosidase|nr:pullulanase-type alpha-1,6-glucosidase [Xanthomonadales bacterium]